MKLLKYRWVINITPTQDTNDQIERELFIKNIQDAQLIFGPESINYDYAKERFALNIKEDPSKFFLDDGGAGIMSKLQASVGVGQQNGGGGAPVAGNSALKMTPPTIKPVKM